MLYVTAQDLQNALVRMLGGSSSPEEVEDVRAAIRDALRTVSAAHLWPYYHSFYTLTTNEPYATGTVTYTAATRALTLSGGTWPDWAAAGVVILPSTATPAFHCRVETRDSATQLTLRADDAPVDDQSGVSYTLYRYQFELDGELNIYKFGKPQVDHVRVLEYMPPELFETDVRRPYLISGTKPRWFTISRGQTAGRTCLSLWPYPLEELRLRFGYLRHPRTIKTWLEDTGTVSTTSGSTAVTGSGTSFTSDHAHCLLRTASSRNDLPTHRDGRHPPVDEALVASRTSATAIVAAATLSATATDVAYTLSDVLDYDVHTMHEVVKYAARRQLARLRNEDAKVQALHDRNYQEALYLAKCQSGGADTIQLAARLGGSRREAWPGLFDSYFQFT